MNTKKLSTKKLNTKKSLRAHLLGTPQIYVDDVLMSSFERVKSEALLYYLLTTAQEHTRSALATMLWPDSKPATSRRFLSNHFMPIRQHLGDYLTITSDTLAFTPTVDCVVDVHQLSRLNFAEIDVNKVDAAQVTQLNDVACLCQGDFLAGFEVPNTELFDMWMDQMREMLSTQTAVLFYTLAQIDAQQRDHTQALAHIDRLLTIVPWHEQGYRLKIQILSETGARWAALEQYATLKDVLANELDVLPDEETERLVAQIRAERYEGEQDGPSPSASSAPSTASLSASTTFLKTHTAPVPLTPLLGQDALLTEALTLLQNPDHRLLTLTGMGGVGKSHMALTLGQHCYDHYHSRFTEGVCFVPLGGVIPLTGVTNQTVLETTKEAILIEIAAALSLPPNNRVDLQEQITCYLHKRALLLIVDNFEHVLAAKPLLVTLMGYAPRCAFLVTSRVRLQLSGETVLRLNPLPVPQSARLIQQVWRDLHDEETAETDLHTGNSAYAGVQLFLDRARRHHSGLEIHQDDFAYIAEICMQTGGLPLALEMVAAWTEHLTLQRISIQLGKNRALLTKENTGILTGEATSVAWHETIDALIEHSWQLLSTADQEVLIQLAFFAGSFDYEAVADIVDASLPQLKRLTDHSLLSIRQAGRYELHSLVQAFLREQGQKVYQAGGIEGSPKEAAFWQRYCRYFLTLLMEQGARLGGVETVDALTRLRQEQDHIELAWRQALEHRWITLVGPVFDALVLFYTFNGAHQEIFSHCEKFEKILQMLVDETPTDQLLFNVGVVRLETYRRLSRHEEGLTVGRTLSAYLIAPISTAPISTDPASTDPAFELPVSPAQVIWDLRLRYHIAMAYLSMLASALTEVRQHIHLASQQLSAQSPLSLHGRYEMLLAYQTSFYDSNLEMGLEHGERALDYYRQSGNRWGEAEMLYEMGTLLASYRHGSEVMVDYLQESLRIRQQLHDRTGEAETLTTLGTIHQGANYGQRIAYLKASMDIHDALGHEYRRRYTLTALAAEYIALGQYQQVIEWLEPLVTDVDVMADPNLFYHVLGNLGIAASLQGNAQSGQVYTGQRYARQMLTLRPKIAQKQQLLAHIVMGYAYIAGDSLNEAQATFEEALAQATSQLNQSAEMIPRTGLADVGYRMHMRKDRRLRLSALNAAKNNDESIANARTHVEWLYPRLGTEAHKQSGREFFWPHWVCYQVLRVFNDSRADDLLARMHGQLLQWADELTDEVLRDSFLNHVAVNRLILAEVERR